MNDDTLIPDGWTGDDALMVAAFLERTAKAIWDQHGLRMGQTLQRMVCQPRTTPQTSDETSDDIERRLPF